MPNSRRRGTSQEARAYGVLQLHLALWRRQLPFTTTMSESMPVTSLDREHKTRVETKSRGRQARADLGALWTGSV